MSKRIPKPSPNALVAEIRAWLSIIAGKYVDAAPSLGRMRITKKMSDGSVVSFTYAEPKQKGRGR